MRMVTRLYNIARKIVGLKPVRYYSVTLNGRKLRIEREKDNNTVVPLKWERDEHETMYL